jgi:hypothetical protein
MGLLDKIKDLNDSLKDGKPWTTIVYVVLFITIIVLFIVFFTKKTGNLRNVMNAYTVLTLIFAVCSFLSIAIDLLASDGEINYGYVASFLINAILGMVTLFMFGKMALFITLMVLFFIGLIFLITLTNTAKSDSATSGTIDEGTGAIGDRFNEFLKFCQLDSTTAWDGSKLFTVLNYGWSDNLHKVLSWTSWFIWIICCIVVIPLMLIIWGGSGIYQLLKYMFGSISSSSSPISASGMTNVKQNDTLHWIGILILFMAVIVGLFFSQSAMRKNPIPVIGMGIVAAIAFLGYVKFTETVSFSNAFIGVIATLFMLYLYVFNPYNVFDKMSGINLFAIFLIFLGILGMIYVVNAPSGTTGTTGKTMKQLFVDNYMKLIKGVFGLFFSVGFILFLVASIGSFQSSDDKPTPGIYILNTLIVVGMLTIVFNVLDAKYKIRDNVGFKLLVELIFYIPCLLSDLADLIMSEYYKTKYFTLILVVLEIIFIIFYWFLYERVVSKIYTGGGKVLINSPVQLNKVKTVGYYRNLSGDDTIDIVSGKKVTDAKDENGNLIFPTKVNTYKFGISCWVFINPMPSHGVIPLTILNYGNNPVVSYSPQNNELTVNVMNSECSNTISVYANKNPPMQKWFNLILNYDGGHLDIFLDSVLVQTSTDVISCVKYDELTIGDSSGVLNAKMCNFIYFKTPLDILTVHNMYNITKIDDTPDIPKRDLFSI